jgi:bifunctional non-homologous end joining protein LigD
MSPPERRSPGRTTAMPEFIEPMAAMLFAEPFDDPDWLFEVKWDGFRVEAVVTGRDVRLWTRGRQDASRYFGSFLSPPTWLAAKQAIVDGEVIAFGDHGEPDFALLQERIRARGATMTGGESSLVYAVFDLLYLDGRSLIDLPLDERRAALQGVLRPDPRVRLSDHAEGSGVAFFAEARRRGLEGIVAKDRRAPYLPGVRSDRWRKIKNRPEQELIVGGWAAGKGAAVDLGALFVGINEGGRLRYVGKVGSGFTRDTRTELLAALGPLETDQPPFDPAPPKRLQAGAVWVRPELVIRADFAGWTSDGNVRQASYKGLDRGKDPGLVIREVPRSSA